MSHLNAFIATHKNLFALDDNNPCQAFCLCPSPTIAHPHSYNMPTVHCVISHNQHQQFGLSFFVDHFCLPDFATSQRANFLWEHTCFECFFAQMDTSYVEINASPTGAFACYRFDRYRSPNHLPPNRCPSTRFDWVDCADNRRHFSITLQVPSCLINPTAILYTQTATNQTEAIFYAIRHATPPDFHNTHYWQTI